MDGSMEHLQQTMPRARIASRVWGVLMAAIRVHRPVSVWCLLLLMAAAGTHGEELLESLMKEYYAATVAWDKDPSASEAGHKEWIDRFEQVVEHTAEDQLEPMVLLHLGQLYGWTQDWERAIATWQKAAGLPQVDPTTRHAAEGMAYRLARMRKMPLQRVLALFDAQCRDLPQVNFYDERSRTYGQTEQAGMLYERAEILLEHEAYAEAMDSLQAHVDFLRSAQLPPDVADELAQRRQDVAGTLGRLAGVCVMYAEYLKAAGQRDEGRSWRERSNRTLKELLDRSRTLGQTERPGALYEQAEILLEYEVYPEAVDSLQAHVDFLRSTQLSSDVADKLARKKQNVAGTLARLAGVCVMYAECLEAAGQEELGHSWRERSNRALKDLLTSETPLHFESRMCKCGHKETGLLSGSEAWHPTQQLLENERRLGVPIEVYYDDAVKYMPVTQDGAVLFVANELLRMANTKSASDAESDVKDDLCLVVCEAVQRVMPDKYAKEWTYQDAWLTRLSLAIARKRVDTAQECVAALSSLPLGELANDWFARLQKRLLRLMNGATTAPEPFTRMMQAIEKVAANIPAASDGAGEVARDRRTQSVSVASGILVGVAVILLLAAVVVRRREHAK